MAAILPDYRPTSVLRVCAVLVALCLAVGFGESAHAACTNPAGTAGKTVFNKDYNVPQYCDGEDWVGIGQ